MDPRGSQARRGAASEREHRASLIEAAIAVGAFWILVAASACTQPAIRPWLRAAGLACGALWLLRTRGSSALAGGAGWARLACAGIAGYTALPLVCVMTGATLGGLGFRMGAVPPAGGLTLDLLSQCVIGPVVEELLYRERLLAALRGRCGDALAISLASLIFAVPHARPELVVGLTWLGVPLGLLAARGGSLAPCIALHAGFNLAGVLAGAPSQRLMPSLAPSVAIFALAFVAASGLARRR